MIHYHSDLRWPVFTPLIIIKIDCRTQGHKINVYRCPIDVMRCSRKVTLWRSFYKMYPIFTHLSTLNLIKHLHSIRSSKRKYTYIEFFSGRRRPIGSAQHSNMCAMYAMLPCVCRTTLLGLS